MHLDRFATTTIISSTSMQYSYVTLKVLDRSACISNNSTSILHREIKLGWSWYTLKYRVMMNSIKRTCEYNSCDLNITLTVPDHWEESVCLQTDIGCQWKHTGVYVLNTSACVSNNKHPRVSYISGWSWSKTQDCFVSSRWVDCNQCCCWSWTLLCLDCASVKVGMHRWWLKLAMMNACCMHTTPQWI